MDKKLIEEIKENRNALNRFLRPNQEVDIIKFVRPKTQKIVDFYKSYKEISIATLISTIVIFLWWLSRDLNEWFSGAGKLADMAVSFASAIIVNCFFTYFQVYCVDIKKSKDRWKGIRHALFSITDNLDYIFKAVSYRYKDRSISLADFNDELFNELYDRYNGSDTISYKFNNKEIDVKLHNIINERIEKVTKKVENILAAYEPYMDEECIKLLVDLIGSVKLEDIFNNGQPSDPVIWDGPYRKHSRTYYRMTKNIYMELKDYIDKHERYS